MLIPYHFFDDRYWFDKLFKSVEGIAFWVVLVLVVVGMIYNFFQPDDEDPFTRNSDDDDD